VDAGLVMHPDVTKAQFEDAAVFGTSIAPSGKITKKKRQDRTVELFRLCSGAD
jgi:CO/xanthine dehydrogenase Mo-binding subunit